MFEAILNYHPSTTTEKSQSWHQPQSVTKTRRKCTCKRLNITPSSSCSSLTPEYVSVQLKLDSNKIQQRIQQSQPEYRAQHLRKSPIKNVNISYDELPRPQLLQTDASTSFFTYPLKEPLEVLQCFRKMPAFYNEQLESDYLKMDHMKKVDSFLEEQFYSCSSDDSENDEIREEIFGIQETCKTDQNSVILQLLHEIVHLINKDDPIQNKAIQGTEIASSTVDESSSKLSANESEIKIKVKDTFSKPTSTTQLNSLLWPPQPCFCPSHLPPYNVPYILPFYLMTSALDGVQMPVPVMYEESGSFKDCFSGNKSILSADQLADNLSCMCSTKHGPLENNMKSPCPSLAEIRNIKMDASTQADVNSSPKIFSLKEDIGVKLNFFNDQNVCEEVASFKDCFSGQTSVLTAEQIPSHLSCECPCKQSLLVDIEKTLNFSSLPATGSKNVDASIHSVTDICPQFDSLDNKVEKNVFEGSLETEEYIDEELHPLYVDKIFTEPFDVYNSIADCLREYDDEEPIYRKFTDQEDVANIGEPQDSEMHQSSLDYLMENNDKDPNCEENFKSVIEKREKIKEEVENIAELTELKLVELDNLPAALELIESEELKTEKNEEEIEKPVKPEAHSEPEQLIEPSPELVEEEKKHLKLASAELDELSYEKDENETTVSIELKTENPVEETDASPPLIEEQKYSYTVMTSPVTGQNIYNFLPEIDKPEDSKQLIVYKQSESEEDLHKQENELLGEKEYNLAKAKLTESRRRKKPDDTDQISEHEKALTTLKQGSPAELKFFIDSLILDLEAMDYARRKSQFENNICKSKKMGLCARESFPVTITDVTCLGADSLYVKWKIHDCFGIGGYEIYTDGHLTNRYYNSRHDAAVITHVDITLPHKIALVAQSSTADKSFDDICNMTRNGNRIKSLPWKTTEVGLRKSFSALWTPSIFLYDAFSDRIPDTSPFLQNNF